MANYFKIGGIIALGYIASFIAVELFGFDSSFLYIFGLALYCLYLASNIDDQKAELSFLNERIDTLEEENRQELNAVYRTTDWLEKEIGEHKDNHN